MDDKTEEFNSFFNETYTLFKKVTSYAILLEKYGGGKVLVASINELRGVLFHLYNILDENGEQQKTANLIEAKEHLYRSYYDLFSKICVILAEKIHSYQKKFGVETMASVFPDYYKEIFPRLNKLKQDISHVRSTREVGRGISDNNDKNHEIIIQLLDWNDSLESLTVALIEKRRVDRKKSNHNVVWVFVSSIIGAIVGAVLTYIFTKPQ